MKQSLLSAYVSAFLLLVPCAALADAEKP